jgi:Late embryogenesis abundant protein
VVGDVEPPEVSLAGLAFDQPGLFEQRLRLDVRLRHPNDFALNVERLLFDLVVNDQQLGKGWITASFDVPAFGDAVVPVLMVVPTSDLIERIMELATAPARQLSAGLLARRPDQHREQSDLAPRAGRAARRTRPRPLSANKPAAARQRGSSV